MVTGEKMKLGVRIKRDLKYQVALAKKHRMHYLFMAPYALIFIAFTILPVIISIVLSFTYFNILEPPHWVGLQNYYKLFFNDDLFMTAVRNTFVFAVITGPIGYMLCLMLAWLINELPPKQRALMTLLFYAPSISGGMYMIWSLLFTGDSYGLINGFLIKWGLINVPILFLKNEAYINVVIIIVILWMSLGTSFLSMIAGFQGIDKQYYEAAAIDGVKNRWQELWFVTLPLMKPQLLFSAVLSITGAFGIGDVITNLAGYPSVNNVALTLMNYLTDYGTIRFEMGYACAIATLLFIIMVLCNKGIQKILARVGT
jgi:multiple sugar transport system permease protein